MRFLQLDVVIRREFVLEVCVAFLEINQVIGEERKGLGNAFRFNGRRFTEQGTDRRGVRVAVLVGNLALIAQVRLIPNCAMRHSVQWPF